MAEQRQTQMAVNRMTGPVRPGPVAAVTLTPKEVLGILRRHILLIVSLAILGFIIGGVSWGLLRKYNPKYTAQTIIRVLSPVEKDPKIIGGALTSANIQYNYRLSIASLIKRQGTLGRLIDRDKVRETKWFKRFGEIKDKCIRRAHRDLNKHFGAYAHEDTEFVVLSMTCRDKVEAALIVNEMVVLFLAEQGGTKRKEITEKLERLNDQLKRLQRDLASAEVALTDVRDRYGFTDLEDRNFEHTITLRLNDLELEQNRLLLQINQVKAAIGTLEKLAVGLINEQVEHEIETDSVMTMLAQQFAIREAELAGILTKFGENHRVVRQKRELINEIRERRQIRKAEIAEQTRQANFKNAQDDLIVLTGRLEELERIRQETTARKRDFDSARVQYEQRASVRNERKQRLQEIKAQIENWKIVLDDPETPKVQHVGYAQIPLEIISPKWKIYFPGGTMLGFLLGIGFAFLIELLNDLVRTPRDVSKFLHIPLLGVIPDAAEDEQIRDVDLCHIVRQAPYSMVSESYRRFRTNLKLSGSGQSIKALLVSSGMAGDGKTSVAINLATTFIAENKKVLLIDANFRRPSLHTIFPKPQAQGETVEQYDFGLSNLLMAQCGYQEVIRSTGIEDFDIIDSGPLPSNPAELLGGAQMEQLVKQQRQNYDYVIIDGPPVLLVSDAKLLARVVDGTILVFNATSTRRGAAQRTIRELKEVNAEITGCVLFAVKAMKGGYYHEQFHFYQEYQKLQLAHSI